MTNERLAEEIRVLAKLAAIEGSDEFRARHYERLAERIESLTEPIQELYASGRLSELPGVGRSSVRLIGEYLETGTSSALQRLEEKVPRSVLELLEIPGIGPKTAGRLFRELGIASVDGLEAALNEGRLRKLRGLGKKTEARLREGVTRYRRRNVERPLVEVLQLIEEIAQALATVPEVTAVGPAGEARRGWELVHRADLVVGAVDIGRAALFLHQMGIGEGHPKTLIHAELEGGFPIRIRLTPANQFGITWLWETADAAHREALTALARQQSRAPLDHPDAWTDADEADVYAALGLPWIPPELREGDGAIRRALQGDWPTLVSQEHYRGELHCHTNASDGRHSLEAMAHAAQARGYQYLAITDHSRSSVHARGLDLDRLARHVEAIRELNERLDDLELLAGAEVDILPDGSLDYPDAVLAELDWVVASVHSHFGLSQQAQTRRLCRAMENPYVRVLGHPTGRLLGSRDPYPVDVDRLIEKAAETGVALELNASPHRLDLGAKWCARARAAGVRLAINTDAHRQSDFDALELGLKVARRAWLEPQHVVNTWPLAAVRRFRDPKPH